MHTMQPSGQGRIHFKLRDHTSRSEVVGNPLE